MALIFFMSPEVENVINSGVALTMSLVSREDFAPAELYRLLTA